MVVAGEKGALSMWDGNGKLLMRQEDTDAVCALCSKSDFSLPDTDSLL